MPNRMTPDGNANKRLDILRCKMDNGEMAYMELARSIQDHTVEIIKENIVLMKYLQDPLEYKGSELFPQPSR